MTMEDQIRHKLKAHFKIHLLEVINESARHFPPEKTNTHFRVLIVSDDFKGLDTVKRHQKVYQTLKQELKGPVHAFSQQTFTPEEWKAATQVPSPPCHHKN